MIDKLVRKDIESLRFNLPVVPKQYINLSQNEPFKRIIGDKYTYRYIGPNYFELKNRLALHHGLDRDNFVITAGANHAIDICCRCFLEHGDSCALYEPTYAQYYMIAKVNGKDVIKFQLNADFEPDWHLFEESPAKLVFISNPNNPVGNVLSLDKIKEGLEIGKIVVVDEAYADFSNNSAIELIDSYENLIIIRTFSKAWTLPGARVGYTIADKKTTDYIELSHIPFHMSNPSLKLAYDVLEKEEDMREFVKETSMLREDLRAGLKNLGLFPYPSYTNFVLVKFPDQLDADAIHSNLIEKGIYVSNTSKQKGIENSLRISVGTREDNELLLKNLAKILKE